MTIPCTILLKQISLNKRHVFNYEHPGQATLVTAMNIQGDVVVHSFYTQSISQPASGPNIITNNNMHVHVRIILIMYNNVLCTKFYHFYHVVFGVISFVRYR